VSHFSSRYSVGERSYLCGLSVRFTDFSSKQKALTNLVNDSVVGVIMSDDFSDISDGEVVSAKQLIEELYGDDTDTDLVQPGKVSPGSI